MSWLLQGRPNGPAKNPDARQHDHLGTPDNGLVAIDSFPIETHYAAKTHGSLAEIDPRNLPDAISDDTDPEDTDPRNLPDAIADDTDPGDTP